MTQSLSDLPKTAQPAVAEPEFRCRQSDLLAAMISSFPGEFRAMAHTGEQLQVKLLEEWKWITGL